MRASPAFQLVLDRFGVWRSGVFVCVGLATLVMSGWILAQPPAASAVVLAGAGMLALMALGLSAAHVRPVSLRWDGRLWRLGPPESAGNETLGGELLVLIDLGSWMLLRFEPGLSSGRRKVVWLPAQRLGLDETSWHALRCAVYSPRPPPVDAAPADV